MYGESAKQFRINEKADCQPASDYAVSKLNAEIALKNIYDMDAFNLFDYLEAGKSIDMFIEDFDTINKKQILQLLELTNKLLLTSTQILNENFA